jgi:acyl-CoA synthetase (AMP-forming)/AMP-acid ligase II
VHARTKLSGYKVPITIRIVAGLPLSPAGRVLRRHVRQPYWADEDRTV